MARLYQHQKQELPDGLAGVAGGGLLGRVELAVPLGAGQVPLTSGFNSREEEEILR